jgi:hypothetical protein
MVYNNYTKQDKITLVRCQGQNKDKTWRILYQLHKQKSWKRTRTRWYYCSNKTWHTLGMKWIKSTKGDNLHWTKLRNGALQTFHLLSNEAF